jgi:hypothetical protein
MISTVGANLQLQVFTAKINEKCVPEPPKTKKSIPKPQKTIIHGPRPPKNPSFYFLLAIKNNEPNTNNLQINPKNQPKHSKNLALQPPKT